MTFINFQLLTTYIQKQMSRRNRKDKQSRDFLCSCGKAYLSYPALHTHIKKYHQPQENMLRLATMPQREKLKRGRPVHNRVSTNSQEYDQLTFIQISVLKIYQELTLFNQSGILLQGDSELNQIQLQNRYRQCLNQQAKSIIQLASTQQLSDYEQMLHPLTDNLIKHFILDISVRLKVMILIGCIEHQIEGSQKRSCITKMSTFGWGSSHLLIGQILYDVLMRALQRRTTQQQILHSHDE